MHPWTASSIPDFIFLRSVRLSPFAVGTEISPLTKKPPQNINFCFKVTEFLLVMRVWAWAKTQRPNCSFQYKTLVLWWVLESQIINADINYKVLEKPADVKNNANLSVGFKCKVTWKP